MTQNKIRGLGLLGVGWLLLLSAGCADEALDSDEYAFVLTAHDPDHDFSKARTYAMPEKVFDLSDFAEDPRELDHDNDRLILNTLAEQMASFGYDRVADPQSAEADVVLAVGAVATDNWVYGTGYWGYDYYYWYGWGYYYPSTVAVNFTTGTLVLMMFSPEEIDTDLKQLPVIWGAGLSAVLNSLSPSEIEAAIAQAFTQSSEYLTVGTPVAAEPGLEEPEFDTEVDTGFGRSVMNSKIKVLLSASLTLVFLMAVQSELNAQETLEAQSVEPQPVEAQPVEPQPVEPQPVEHQPAEAQPVEVVNVPKEAPAKAKKDEFDHHLPILAWSMGLPVGSSYNHVGDFSLSGIIFEYRYRINSKFSVGGLIGWNTFNEKETGTETQDNLAVTGTQLRWLESVPLALSGNYYFPLGQRVQGFVGLNLGAYWINRFVDFAWWRVDDSAWHFGLAPDLGVLIPLKNVALVLSSKFNYLVKSGDSPQELFFTFNVGLGFLN